MLPVLQAERQLLAIEAASVPHMTAETRRVVFARLERRATSARKPKSAVEALAGLPIRVVEIPKKR